MTKTGWLVAGALAVAVAIFLALQFARSHDDRFGDPAVLDQIENSNCGELRQWSEEDLRVLADPDHTDEELDQALGYANAANDRMEELGCFEN